MKEGNFILHTLGLDTLEPPKQKKIADAKG